MQAREHLPALLPVKVQIDGVPRQPVAVDLPFLRLFSRASALVSPSRVAATRGQGSP